MAKNSTLNKAKETKYDEFFTQLTDIEKELAHYKSHFENKVVFCNCDDPEYSNFWKYFSLNFDALKLKKLLATHFEREKQSYKLMMYRDEKGVHTEIKTLSQNGDFRSPECIELLKESDIVVTNPPFSLFRDYIKQLFYFNKNFLIICNPNSLHYKEIFPYVQENKIWVGYKPMKQDMLFDVSEKYAEWLVANKKKGSGYRIVDGKVKGRTQAIWCTNLDVKKKHEWQYLFRRYSDGKFKKYINLNAIDIEQIVDIPCDYDGYIGVPDTILETYNPEQFKIVGLGTGNLAKEIGVEKNYRGRTDIYYIDDNGEPRCPYNRIIIKVIKAFKE